MVLNDRPLKRTKRNHRVTENLYDFLTFPEAAFGGPEQKPFRENINDCLSKYARGGYSPPLLFPSLLTWQILFRVGDFDDSDLDVVVGLDIIEEDVTANHTSNARSAYCNQCRVVGWSGHPVCTKRYHFIVRSINSSNCYKCSKCSYLVDLSDSRCKWCNSLTSMDDMEDWVHSQFEDNSHLLHGLVHSNGFGHLLRVNGREGGSNVLTGSQIMDFWDRLCAMLCVRKVSVMDVSRKYGIDYRLLHAITKSHSWYGNWGYKLERGSYAITTDCYNQAVKTLSTVLLAPMLFQRQRPRPRFPALIAFYQSLSDSELLTLQDLCSFMLSLIHESDKSPSPEAMKKNIRASTSKVLCVWTKNDVECVQQAMIKVLMTASSENKWVPRHVLKGVMCKKASPELLDYCLKYLVGKLASNSMVVQARCNHVSYDSEYRLAPLASIPSGNGFDKIQPSKEGVKHDLKYLLDSLRDPDSTLYFGPHLTRKSVIDAATRLLDCKQFMKDYRPDKMTANTTNTIHIMCYVEISDQSKDDPAIPPELIVLPSNATVADLKNEASKAFQEVYAMFKRFEVCDLCEYGSVEDSYTLKFLVGTRGSVKIKGPCPSRQTLNHFRMERGIERWTVDCSCGAKDDDGEKMLACDNCGIWQHTRCAGIDNSDTIPSTFVCVRCEKSHCQESKRTSNFTQVSSSLSETSTCRNEAMQTDTSVRVTCSIP